MVKSKKGHTLYYIAIHDKTIYLISHVHVGTWGSTKIRDTSGDRDGITSNESSIYRDDDIYVTAIFC